MSEKPVDVVKVGRIKTTIWENRTDAGKSYFSLTITRTYRADNGDWKDTATFSPEDLPRIRLASDKAFDKINELMEQQQANQKAASGKEADIQSAPSNKRRGSKRSFTEKVDTEREGQGSKGK